MSTRPWIVDDDLWALVEPLLPPWPEKAPGPRPVDDRLCPQGILYVLHNDMAWQLLPLELGFGSSIRREWAWRVKRGESLANLQAFRSFAERKSEVVAERAEE